MSATDSTDSTSRVGTREGMREVRQDTAQGTASEVGAASVDADNPWLGLASFTEESRAYFFGREGEVAELTRRVQRKLLTVLFGKSGLGKTSILRAGLVPRLRSQGYFPVYLRIDYGHDSPEPGEQIKQAINKAARDLGSVRGAEGGGGGGEPGTASAVAAPEESIWEFLHHRDDKLKDSSGHTLTPLLIFDQFEELFTLAQSDEFGRTRAGKFIEELSDLVENRPPKALEAKLESEDGEAEGGSIAERFDFSRSDYRVVIALREDYLAPLESLKKGMPSLSQNRLRLAPMTGNQALEAVLQPGNRLRPGKPLVSEEVAEAIVRFVAGGSELANAEVEPSLLSLICRELNEQRIAQHRSEISQDLLAGSHDTILSTFYERSLADQPESVRRIIEDDLLTESGYRENLAEESLLRRFQAAGAAPDALAKLVNRRLLRIEERLDVRRVELTHDVLTGVVKASRDQRHEREAKEATERALAEQRDRENTARRALRRTRAVAAGCAALALLALAAMVAAVLSVQRARHAEEVARQTRAVSEQARQEAEGLLSFLTDDFVSELETFGRYQTIAELSQREIDYFQNLPPQLKDPETVRSGALALMNHAEALQYLGNLDAAAKNATEAVALLEALRRTDRSEATTIALGRAYQVRSSISGAQNASVRADAARTVALLRPIARTSASPVGARRAYVEALNTLGFQATSTDQAELNTEAVGFEREAVRLAQQPGSRRGDDPKLATDYATAAAWLSLALANLGRSAEALRVGRDGLAVADQIVAQRPQYGEAVLAKEILQSTLGQAAHNAFDPSDAVRLSMQSVQTGLAAVGLEPKNTEYVGDLAFMYGGLGVDLWAAGQLRDSLAYDRKALDAFGQSGASLGGGGYSLAGVSDYLATMAYEQALLDEPAGISATTKAADAFTSPSMLRKLGLAGSYTEAFVDAMRSYPAAALAYERGDFAAARHIVGDALASLQTHRPSGALEISLRDDALYRLSDLEGHAEYALGAFAAAEQAERVALRATQGAATYAFFDPRRTEGQVATWLSMALARQGKRAQAARTIDPVVTTYRRLEKQNHGDQWLPLEYAEALYAQSLTDPAHRAALLRQASGLVARLIPAIARLHDTREWRARIEAARHAGRGVTAQ